MTIWDYKVTTPYGQVPGYPLNDGFHKGIDYGCPIGTPITVNGVTIGLSGNTGASTGPHTHVGKWLGAVVQDPTVQGGKTFKNAVVTEVGEDPTNGKFVRVQGDGYSYVYLHMSKQLAKVGQVLKEALPMRYPDKGNLVNFYNRTGWPGHPINANDIAYWTKGTSNPLWSKGADFVWAELCNEISLYVVAHPKTIGPVEIKYNPYSGPALFTKG